MKKILFILLLAISNIALVNAQDNNNNDDQRADKIEALKVAFITQKLNITSEEAQRFWPVYNRYETEMHQALKNNNNDVIDNDEKILNIRKKYRAEFSNTLGPDRVNNLFKSENEFRSVLMRKLRNRSAMQQQRPNRPMNQNWKRR